MKTKINEIKKKVEWLESHAPMTMDGYITKGGNGFDDCIYSGLLSTVRETCGTIAHCQNTMTGKVYRSPELNRKNNMDPNLKAEFSRDQAMGFLLYLATSKNIFAAKQWLKYIDSLKQCKVKKPKWMGGGCLYWNPIQHYAPNSQDRATISPNMWSLMYMVWKI